MLQTRTLSKTASVPVLFRVKRQFPLVLRPTFAIRSSTTAPPQHGIDRKTNHVVRLRVPLLPYLHFPHSPLRSREMKVFFFSTHSYDRNSFDSVKKPSNVAFTYDPSTLSPINASIAEGHEAVCIFVNDDCSGEVIRILYEYGVKAILLRCAGSNNVDLKTAKDLGMFVARVPAYSPEAIAEHTIALIMTLNRKTHRAFNRVREMNFSLKGLLGFTVHGKTVGLIGTGRIGLCTAKILKGFGARVLAYDVVENPEFKSFGEYVPSLEALLPQCDIVSLHAPLLGSTKKMINEKTIAMMKPGAILANTSRGALVDHTAIIKALKSKHLGGVAIDVYEAEEGLFFQNHEGEILDDEIISRLMTFHNVLITGHQGFFTSESLDEIAHVTLFNLECFAEGKECPNAL